MSKVIILIGVAKTGTTAIQDFLYVNRARLRGMGIDYTTIGFYNLGFAHHTLSHKWGGWISADQITEDPDKAWDALEAHVAKTNDTIVISSERFAGLSACADRYGEVLGFIRDKLKAAADVQIIGYVRRQDDLVVSAYKQAVKAGIAEEPLERYLDRLHPAAYQFGDIFGRWAEYFGAENVQACIYDRACFVNGDLVQDFFHAAGLPYPKNPQRSSKHRRPSIGTVSTKLFSDLSMSGMPHDRLRSAAQRAFDDLSLEDPDQNHLLNAEQRQAIMKQYEKSNAELLRLYVRRDPGNAFAVDRDRGAFDPDKPQFSYKQMLTLVKAFDHALGADERTKGLEGERGRRDEKARELIDQIRGLKDQLRTIRAANAELRNTLSWKITAPLRAVRAWGRPRRLER